jgi:hypothetical protein
MNKKVLKYSLLIVFSIVLKGMQAQVRGLDSLAFIDVGAYKAVVSEGDKISEKPSIVDSTKKLKVGPYNIESKRISTSYDPDTIAAAQMVGEPLTKLYKGLVKGGLGNYTTPYAEAWYNSLRSKEISYGLRFKLFSSQTRIGDYGFGGFSDNEVSLYGKKFLKEHTLSGNFDFVNEGLHFYGYDKRLYQIEKKDSTLQRFNFITGGLVFKSQYSSLKKINHEVKLNFYNLQDNYKAGESNFKASGNVYTAVEKDLLNVNAELDYYNYRSPADTVNNTIFTLNPTYLIKGEKSHVAVGLTSTTDIFSKTKFYFYPSFDFSYNVLENIIVPYVGEQGKLQKNSFRSLTNANPYVLSSLPMQNTNQKYEFYAGIKGTLSSTIAYNAKVTSSQIQNLPLFVNNTTQPLQNRFDVIYDDAKLTTIYGEVSYQQREKLRINMSGKYLNYQMKHEARAWYTPQLELKLSANYNLKDKIVGKAELTYLSPQFAKTFVNDASSATGKKVVAQELKGILDANIGCEYRYTKRLGFFLNFNNILNVRYYRYSNYPTQRLGLMAGGSWTF